MSGCVIIQYLVCMRSRSHLVDSYYYEFGGLASFSRVVWMVGQHPLSKKKKKS